MLKSLRSSLRNQTILIVASTVAVCGVVSLMVAGSLLLKGLRRLKGRSLSQMLGEFAIESIVSFRQFHQKTKIGPLGMMLGIT